MIDLLMTQVAFLLNVNSQLNSQLTLEPKIQNSDTSQHWQFLRKFPPPAFTHSFSFIMEEVLQEIQFEGDIIY